MIVSSMYKFLIGLVLAAAIPALAQAATTLTISEQVQNPGTSAYYDTTTLVDQTTTTFRTIFTNSGSDQAYKISSE